MRWNEVELLDEAGFSLYEKRALVTLMLLGVADAAALCREGDIPTSKIYQCRLITSLTEMRLNSTDAKVS